ncbi:hypothetical protein C8J55DRAFT_556317 [Lentinula edodes]|uniref:Uncharacterized protein n=1 Tax=Lentinula lateritia TaxID=40482 RepID=A0A9W9AWB4_9AGAR|nr:hypothetical protein C8J55DRAFT_556317 [Lentinula edodes]
MRSFEVRSIIGHKRQDLHPYVADDGSEIVQRKEYSRAKRFKGMPGEWEFTANLALHMNNLAASPFSEYNEIRNGDGPESVDEDQTRSSLAAMNVESFDTVPQNRTFEPFASQANLLLHSNVVDETQLIPSCGLDRKNSIFPHAQSLDHASHEDSLAQSISSRSTPDRGKVEFELVTARGASDQQKMFTSIGFDSNADISPHPHSSNRVSPTGFQNAQKEDEELDFRLYHSEELLPELNPSFSAYDTPNAFRQDQGAPELESFPGDPQSGAQNEMRMFHRYDLSDSSDDVSLHAQYLDDVSEAGLEISHKEGKEGTSIFQLSSPNPHNTLDPLDEFGDDLGFDSSLHAHTSRFAFSPHSDMLYNAEDDMQTSDYGTNKSEYDYGMDDPLSRDSESTHFYAGDPFDGIGDSPPSDSTLYPHTPRSTPYVLSSVADEIQTSDLDGRHEGDNNGQGMEDSLKQDLRYDRFHTGEPSDEFGDNHGSDSSPYLRTTHAFKDEPVSASSPHPPMDIAEDESQTSDIDGRNEGKDDGHRMEDLSLYAYNPQSASLHHPHMSFIAEDQMSDVDGHRMEDPHNQDSEYDHFQTGHPFNEFGDSLGSDSSSYPRTIPNAFDDACNEPVSASSPHPPMVINCEDKMQTSGVDGRDQNEGKGYRLEDLLNQHSGSTRFHASDPFDKFGVNPESGPSPHAHIPWSASSLHPHMSSSAEDKMQTFDFSGRNEGEGKDPSPYAHIPCSASSPHPQMQMSDFFVRNEGKDEGYIMADSLNQKNSGHMQFHAGTWHEIHVDPSDPSHLLVKVPIDHNINVKADNPGYGTYPFSALTGADFPHHPTGSYDVNNAHNDAESSYVQPEMPADFRFDYRNFKIDSSFYPVHVPLNAINTFELNGDRSNCFRLGPDESERNTGADTSSENSTVDELFQSMPNGQEQVPGYSNHNMHRDTCLNEGDLARIGHQSSSFNTEGLLLVPSPALGINTPSSSDMPSTSEYNMKGLSAFNDTGCNADDEGVDDGDGDWEMQYEDVGLANNGNATQISSDYDGVRAFEMEVPHAHMSHNTHVDHHYPPCNSSHETCNCDSRPQNFVSHHHLGVPPVQGDMLTPESHGTFGDTNNQQGVTPLSPLTEIPDIPMAAESSIEDEKYLRTELESLVASSCMYFRKSHFTSQLNQPPFDKVKLRSLLDSCYCYVGVLTDHDPPSPSSHPDTSHLFPRHGPKLYKAPQHRPHSKVELTERVCYEVGCLLGRVNDQHNPEFTAKPLSTVPSTTIDSWRRSGAGGPTLNNFVLQLCDGKYTDWNKTAAQVFSRYLRSWEEYKGFTIKSIEEAFLVHLSQLRKDFERQGQLKSIDERDAEQRMRRLRRRNAELRRRISSLEEILACHSDVLRELCDVYKRITVECISGDESESGPEPNSDRVYYRTSRVWSSKQFEEFQILLRAWHAGSRYIGGGKYSNGRFPHPRYPSSRSESIFNPDIALQILAVGPDVPLTLPQEEVRFAKRFLHVKYRKTLPLPEDHPSLDV